MRAILPLLFIALVGTACRKEYEAPVPNTTWDLFNSIGTRPVDPMAQQRMNGVYAVTQGADMFGQEVALKWTSTHQGSDSTYSISIFCGKDIGYITGEGRYLDSTMLLNTYWRTMANTGTGQCRMMIHYAQGVRQLWGTAPIAADSIVITGAYGDGQDLPERPFALHYKRPLHTQNNVEVLAHRCGGRNADLLPVSENSVEMIRMAPRFGATGVEMDVRVTSDGVPVIYHDETLNDRCIQPCGLFGPLEAYSYAQLSGLVRLINGEKIPTLREALTAVVENTSLHYVWLDTKAAGGYMPLIHDIQNEYLSDAQGLGRDVRILIGLPEDEQLNAFLDLPDHADIPSLCELSIDDVHSANAEVWAPRWTLGMQNAEVAQMHGEGRKVFVWTLDIPDYIQQYLTEGGFDGILSNYPTLVAYYNYVRP